MVPPWARIPENSEAVAVLETDYFHAIYVDGGTGDSADCGIQAGCVTTGCQDSTGLGNRFGHWYILRYHRL